MDYLNLSKEVSYALRHAPPMIAPASTLVLFNKNITNFLPINVGRTNVQNPLDFVTALLVDRHKRGRLRHRGGKLKSKRARYDL